SARARIPVMSPEADRGRTRPGYFIVRSCRASLSGFPVDILVQGALPARHEVGGVCPVYPGQTPTGDVLGHVLGTTGKRLWQPGHALAKRMRLAEGHRARHRDSHDRRTGLRLAATTVKAIPTVSPAQRKGGSVSASPAKRPLGCSERCIRNLAARQ